MYDFYECKIHKKVDKFLDIIVLFLGDIGEIITGFLEYIKGRTFPSNSYLIYGIYFICFFIVNIYLKKIYPIHKNDIEFFMVHGQV